MYTVHLLRIYRFYFGIVAGVGKIRGTSVNWDFHTVRFSQLLHTGP